MIHFFKYCSNSALKIIAHFYTVCPTHKQGCVNLIGNVPQIQLFNVTRFAQHCFSLFVLENAKMNKELSNCWTAKDLTLAHLKIRNSENHIYNKQLLFSGRSGKLGVQHKHILTKKWHNFKNIWPNHDVILLDTHPLRLRVS